MAAGLTDHLRALTEWLTYPSVQRQKDTKGLERNNLGTLPVFAQRKWDFPPYGDLVPLRLPREDRKHLPLPLDAQPLPKWLGRHFGSEMARQS